MIAFGQFLEVFISGLLAGVLYSLVALGFVLIYKASGIFNYAQGVMALFAAFEHTASRGKAAAILSIVGAVNLPIIKYSVNWWNTLHQGSTFTVTERPKMPPDMYIPLLLMMLGSYFLVAALTIYRTNTLILQRESSKQWVIDECKRLYR